MRTQIQLKLLKLNNVSWGTVAKLTDNVLTATTSQNLLFGIGREINEVLFINNIINKNESPFHEVCL